MLGKSLYSSESIAYVAVLSGQGPVPETACRQILELIQLFYTIWRRPAQDPGALAHAILGGELLLAEQLSRSLGVNLEKLRFLAVCPRPSSEDAQARLTAALEMFLAENGWRFFTDVTDRGIAVFLEAPALPCHAAGQLEQFSSTFLGPAADAPALFLMALPSPASARELFAECVKYMGCARRIFPQKRVFTHHQLPFIRSAVQASLEPPDALRPILAPLEPLQGKQHLQMDLLNTVGAYLLDTSGSLEQTAALLYLHKSTAKYRLRRANEVLGYDIRQVPESYSLGFALAVNRLLG